ncbi:CHAT domain-containing protein [Roseivirga sp.]|uniref:CHAT domain-containing protein n=1 Tax=Roseivirga sp. TaxID=1964215 RepID=UPI003B8C5D14
MTRLLVVIFLFISLPGRNVQAQERTIKTKYEFGTPELSAAQQLYREQRYNEALDAYQSILDNALRATNWEEAIFTMEKKALTLRRLSMDNEVIAVLDEAIGLALEHLPKGHFLVARLYYTRGTTDHNKRNFYNARSYIDTALNYYNAATTYDSSTHYRIIEYRYYSNQYSEADSDTLMSYLTDLVELEELRQKVRTNPNRMLQLLEGYSTIYVQKGDFEQALAYAIKSYKYAIENRAQVSNQYYVEALYALTQVLYRKKEYQKALEIGLKALPIAENTPRSEMPEYYSLNNLMGLLLNAMGEYDSALPYFKKSEDIPFEKGEAFQRRNKKAFYAQVLMNIGICYQNLGLTELAKDNFEESLNTRKQIVSFPSPDFQNNYEFLGDFYFNLSEFDQALLSYDSALRNGLFNYTGDLFSFPESDEMAFSYQDLRTVERKTASMKEVALTNPNPTNSLSSTKEYVERLHGLLIQNRKDLLATEGKLFLSQNFKSLYETGIAVCFELFKITKDESYITQGWKFAKQSKAVLFLEQSSEFEWVKNDALPIEIKELFFSSKTRVEDLQNEFYQLIDNSVTSDSILLINDKLLEARIENQELKDSIELVANSIAPDDLVFQEFLRNNNEVDISPDQALIEYFYGEDFIYVFGKGKSSISFQKVPINRRVEESLESVIRITSKPPTADQMEEQFNSFKVNSNYIFKSLVEPTLKALEKGINHLIVVPDEFLSRIPFGSLLINSGQESYGFNDLEYLLRSYSIQYLLSSELYHGEFLKRKAENEILGVGYTSNQNSNGSYGYLSGTVKEINYLESSFEGKYLLGDEGTKKEFLKSASNYDILHLAIHGKADSANRYESSLIFNGEISQNTLNTNDLYLAGMQARLAVLSACESGLGVINKGEGTFSIARGFALVGIPSVVMSLWQVNDKATSVLMVDMYEGFINEGNSINESLRNAKLKYLSEVDPYQSHPYYWSGFLQLGEDLKYDGKNEVSDKLWVALVAFIILLALYLKFNKKKKG